MSQMTIYKADLFHRYWEYQRVKFPEAESYFERSYAPDGRPPVFLPHQARQNVISKPGAAQEELDRLFHLFPSGEQHKWFRSMNSSQALALSILGNLAIYNHLDCLVELEADEGVSLFGKASLVGKNLKMEFKVKNLGEKQSTSLDGHISGQYPVAIECKFTEAEVGSCSRPKLKPSASNYSTDLCDGNYTHQLGRVTRCSLSEIGVLYWRYIPDLFDWTDDLDLIPCPLNKNYQLVRNIIAIGVEAKGNDSLGIGHVVLIYDERNPAFQTGGAGLVAYEKTRTALKDPSMLRKCSWQRIVRRIREHGLLPWLTEELELKYGL
jgi:hypothetical protein